MNENQGPLVATLHKRLQWHSDQFFNMSVKGVSEDDVETTLSMIADLSDSIFRTNALKTMVQSCPTRATIKAFQDNTAIRFDDDCSAPFLLAVMTYDRLANIKRYLESLTNHQRIFPSRNIEAIVFDFSTSQETVENVKKVIQHQQMIGLTVRHVPAHRLLLFASTCPEVWGLSQGPEFSEISRLVPHSPQWLDHLIKLGYCDFRNLCFIYLRDYISTMDARTIVGFNDDDVLFQNCIADMVTSELRMEFVYDVFGTIADYIKLNPGSVICGNNSLSPPNSAEMLYSATLHDLVNATSIDDDSEADGRSLRLSLLTETYNMFGQRGSSLCKPYGFDCLVTKEETIYKTRMPLCKQPAESDGLVGFVNANCNALMSGNLITRPIVAPPLGRTVNASLSIDSLFQRGPHGTLGNMWAPASVVKDHRFIVPEFGPWRGEDIGLFAVVDAMIAPVLHAPVCLGHWRGGFRRNLMNTSIFACLQDSLCGYVLHRILEYANEEVQQKPGTDFFNEIEKKLATEASSIFRDRQMVQRDMLDGVRKYAEALLARTDIVKYQDLCHTLNRIKFSIDGGIQTVMSASEIEFVSFARSSTERLRRWMFMPDTKLGEPIYGLGRAMVESKCNFRLELLQELQTVDHQSQEEARSFLLKHFGMDWQSPHLALSCLYAGSSLLKYVVVALNTHDRECTKLQLEILAANDHIGLWFAYRGLCELAMTSNQPGKKIHLVAAVIPVYRRRNGDTTETVKNTLKLLIEPRHLAFSLSVIVIDNGRGREGLIPCVDEAELERACRTLGFVRITVLRPNHNIGPLGGRNLGTTVALFHHRADAVLWIDDDPTGLSGLNFAVKDLENNSCVAGFIFLENGSEKNVTFYGGKKSWEDPFPMVPYEALEPHMKIKRNVWAFFGGLCLINRTTLLRCGLLDRRIFAYWEEFELSGRMLKVNENIWFCPSFTATYKNAHTGTALKSDSVVFHDMRNQVVSLRVHGYLPLDLCGGRLTVETVEQKLTSQVLSVTNSLNLPARILEKVQGLESGKGCSLDVPSPHLEWSYKTTVDATFLQLTQECRFDSNFADQESVGKLAAHMTELTLSLFGLFRPPPNGRCNNFRISTKLMDEEDSYVVLPSAKPEECLTLPLTINLGTDLDARTGKIALSIIDAASEVVFAWNDKVHLKQLRYTSDIKNSYAATIVHTNEGHLKAWLGDHTIVQQAISTCKEIVENKYLECEELLKGELSLIKNVDIETAMKWFCHFFNENPCHFMRYAAEESHGLAHTFALFHLLRELKNTEIGEAVFSESEDITACVISCIAHDVTQLWWDKNGEAHPLTGALNAQNMFRKSKLSPILASKTIFCVLHHSSQNMAQLIETYRNNLISKGGLFKGHSLPEKYKQAVKIIEDYGVVPAEHLTLVTLFKCADNLATLDVGRMVQLPSPPRQPFSSNITLKSRVDSIFSTGMLHRSLVYDRLNNVIYAHTRKLALVAKQLGVRSDDFVRNCLQKVVQIAPGLVSECAEKVGYSVNCTLVKEVIIETFIAFAELAPADPRFEGICVEPWKNVIVNEE